MATTPILTLPYPIPDDTVDVPRDIQALATKLDTTITPPSVTTLPPTPYDGQEISYLANASAGHIAIWYFKYRAASVDPSKWDFVGGPPIQVYGPGTIALPDTGGAWSSSSSWTPQYTTPPFPGLYQVKIKAETSSGNPGTTTFYLDLEKASNPGVTAYLDSCGAKVPLLTNSGSTVENLGNVRTAPNELLRLMIATSGPNMDYSNRYLEIIPLAFG